MGRFSLQFAKFGWSYFDQKKKQGYFGKKSNPDNLPFYYRLDTKVTFSVKSVCSQEGVPMPPVQTCSFGTPVPT